MVINLVEVRVVDDLCGDGVFVVGLVAVVLGG